MELLEPTEILSDPRNDGGDAVASAKTADGGVAFVRWDPSAKSWVIDNDLTAGDVIIVNSGGSNGVVDMLIVTTSTSTQVRTALLS